MCEGRSLADGTHRVLVSAVPPDGAYDFDAEALAHLDSVYRVAFWLSGSPDEAQDLTQDTYERALRGRKGFVRTNMRAWLLTILRHRFLNLRRRDRIVEKVALEDTAAVDEPVPEVPITVMRQDLQAALAKLSSDLRLPLLLADVEELSMTEIASTLGWPVGTVKSRLWRARRELGALLRDYGVARE
ncbi:MAG TPA: RNA polymerase sigma factor [Methylomirabilota bacterium]|nr:RNA polymerase sigma factor [Methylomirabilota bacterium]